MSKSYTLKEINGRLLDIIFNLVNNGYKIKKSYSNVENNCMKVKLSLDDSIVEITELLTNDKYVIHVSSTLYNEHIVYYKAYDDVYYTSSAAAKYARAAHENYSKVFTRCLNIDKPCYSIDKISLY